MRFSKSVLLILGLQNFFQLGNFYLLNLLASIYFVSIARFKMRTLLDVIIHIYITLGVVSLIVGLINLLIDGAELHILLNTLKSFLVFLLILVYFGAYSIKIEKFSLSSSYLFVCTVVAIMCTYGYIFLGDPITLYLSRGSIAWLSSWPQRWVVFCLVGHFYFLCRYGVTKRKIDGIFHLLFLASIVLSGTRSAVLGLLIGYSVLSLLSYRDFYRIVIISLCVAVAVFLFYENFQETFRLSEFVEFSSSDSDSSMGYRLNNLWPGIVNSLSTIRIPFGWGHVGPAYIPHEYFADSSLMSNVPGEEAGSAESQYMDVLFRQGVLGLVFYLVINIMGMIYAYILYKYDCSFQRKAIWKSALAWQAAIFVHGVTVETTRFPLYSLFYFLFLGIMSKYYRYVILKRLSIYVP
jgi:hypothetical protein